MQVVHFERYLMDFKSRVLEDLFEQSAHQQKLCEL